MLLAVLRVRLSAPPARVFPGEDGSALQGLLHRVHGRVRQRLARGAQEQDLVRRPQDGVRRTGSLYLKTR